MASHGRGRMRSRGESSNEQPADNHAEFMAAMANLANTMEANAAATLQAMQRLGQLVENENRNGEGKGNENTEGNGDNMGGAPMTLATFLKTAFYKKFFPESAWKAKEMELMQLKQGSLSVVDYTSQFEELLNKVRVVEKYAKTVALSKETSGGNTSRERDDHLGPRGQSFKKDGYAPQHLLGQGNFRRDNTQLHHMKGSCLCYACGLPGHLAKNSRRKKNQNTGQNQ
ncbi:hypothetical protein AHAS_Ahas20G0143900 [Arachis hypogaea]